jgi:hypothetical protein
MTIALYALAAIGRLVVCDAATEPKSRNKCCTGACEQGRLCPHRETTALSWRWIAAYAVAAGLILTFFTYG